jgi:hypothetical protein
VTSHPQGTVPGRGRNGRVPAVPGV